MMTPAEEAALLAEAKRLRAETEQEAALLFPSLSPATLRSLSLTGLRRMCDAAYRRRAR